MGKLINYKVVLVIVFDVLLMIVDGLVIGLMVFGEVKGMEVVE